jgi:hypothetical protein
MNTQPFANGDGLYQNKKERKLSNASNGEKEKVIKNKNKQKEEK